MTTYRMDGRILIITVDPSSTFTERRAVYGALRADPCVPDGALLLLDVRDVEETFTEAVLRSRVAVFFDALGRKLGPVCAMLVSATDNALGRYMFQIIADEKAVNVGLFDDERDARQWLQASVQSVG